MLFFSWLLVLILTGSSIQLWPSGFRKGAYGKDLLIKISVEPASDSMLLGRDCGCMCSGLTWWVRSGCAIWRRKCCTRWVTSITTSVIWWSTWVARHLATSALRRQCPPLPSSSKQFLFRYDQELNVGRNCIAVEGRSLKIPHHNCGSPG